AARVRSVESGVLSLIFPGHAPANSMGPRRSPETVIDLRTLRDNPDRVRDAQKRRGESAEIVDRVLDADERRRSSIAEYERLRAEQKSLGKQVAKAQGEEKTALLARTKEL